MIMNERIESTAKLHLLALFPSIFKDQAPEQGESRGLRGLAKKFVGFETRLYEIPNLYPSLQRTCFHILLFL